MYLGEIIGFTMIGLATAMVTITVLRNAKQFLGKLFVAMVKTYLSEKHPEIPESEWRKW